MTELFREHAKLVQHTAPIDRKTLWAMWGQIVVTPEWFTFDVFPKRGILQKVQPQRVAVFPTATLVSVDVESYQAEVPTGLVAATFRRADDYLLFSLRGFVPQVRLLLEPVARLISRA